MDHMHKHLQENSVKTTPETPTEEAPVRNEIVDMQRYIGNQGVQRMLGDTQVDSKPSTFIQAKLSVSPADDVYEKEADKVAQQVVTGGESDVQREGMEEEEMQMKRADIQREGDMEEEELAMKRADIQREGMEEEEMQMKRADIQREGMEEEEMQMKRADIQREGDMEEEEMQMKRADIQRAGTEAGFEVGGDIEENIQSAKGGGQSLGNSDFFESRMGYDFSNVNVHTDSQADTLNRSLDARAFTTGNDVFFREGEYDPSSKGGQELIAHELTHVVQQGGADVSKKEDKE